MKRDAFLNGHGIDAYLGGPPPFSRESVPQTESGPSWLVDLQLLAAKYSHLGIVSDLAGMNRDELWDVYRFLSRVDLDGVTA
jgi:hypothetical protein